jgi:hypothetical protein
VNATHARAVALGITFALVLGAVACSGDSKEVPNQPATPTPNGTTVSETTPSELTPDEGPIMAGDHAIIRQEAVGPLRIGQWRRPVMSFVYAISARAGRDSEDIIVVRGIGKDTVTLTFDNDTLRRIFVTHTGPRTADGIGVGTPFATVAARPDVTISRRGTGQVATTSRMCGVEFATDSVALSMDSASRKAAASSATIRAISVGYCKR